MSAVATREARHLEQLTDAVEEAITEAQELLTGLHVTVPASMGPVDHVALRSLGGTIAVVEACVRRFAVVGAAFPDTPEDCIRDGLPAFDALPVDFVNCLVGRARASVEVLEHAVRAASPTLLPNTVSMALWSVRGDLDMLEHVVERVREGTT